MFSRNILILAHHLLMIFEGRNNNKWPNKNKDVKTDLGGEGDFPMFLLVRLDKILSDSGARIFNSSLHLSLAIGSRCCD